MRGMNWARRTKRESQRELEMTKKCWRAEARKGSEKGGY